jgi:hypothetical protein
MVNYILIEGFDNVNVLYKPVAHICEWRALSGDFCTFKANTATNS